MKKKITLRELGKLFRKELEFIGDTIFNQNDLSKDYEDIKKMKGKKQLYVEYSSNSVAYFSVKNPYDVRVVCLLHKRG
jgi:hypothetical protein